MNYPKVRFIASSIYSQKLAEASGAEYSRKVYLIEKEAAKKYQEWWDKYELHFMKELYIRLGASLEGGQIICYVVKNLLGGLPFAPPLTVHFFYDSKLGDPITLTIWTPLHELIHYFESLDPKVYKRHREILSTLRNKYGELDAKARMHVVTSLLEESIILSADEEHKSLSRKPYRNHHYPKMYEFVENLSPKYEGGNVFDYLEKVL